MLANYRKQLNEKNEIYLKIKVKPGTGETIVKEIMEDGVIKIDVAALPIKNRANQELIKFLANEFEVSGKNVKIISGAKERSKLIKVIK